MMLPKSLAVLATAATLSLAATPAGFQPASTSDLIVIFNSTTALNGAVIQRTSTTSQPRIGTTTRLNGTSYAILMIDIDIPTNTPPATNTLLHWMQTGLTPSSNATTITVPGSAAPLTVFLLENRTNTTPFVAYFGPNPPARIPLSHRYTEILVDTTGITTQGLNSLQQAASVNGGRVIGFNASAVLAEAGLSGKVVAGNFFNVTNPGPVMANTDANNSTTGSGSGSGNGTSTDGEGSGDGEGDEAGDGTGAGTGNGNGNGFDQGNDGNVTTAGAARLSGEFGGMGMLMATYGAVAMGAVAFSSLFL